MYRFATFILAKLVPSLEMLLGNCMYCILDGLIKKRNVDIYRYLLEHGLKADGRPDPDSKDALEGGSPETFFTETGSGKYVPRSLFVDLDPSVSSFL